MAPDLRKRVGAPGRIRTCDTRFRRAVLYPLSYEGGIARPFCQVSPALAESATTPTAGTSVPKV